MIAKRYNVLLHRLQNLDTNIDNELLDILELFAQTKYLTITNIADLIKSTKLQKAYKNVRGNIQKLNSLYLIEEAIGTERWRHNEKPFKLRDEGIYLLFLKRLQGIFVNQLSVKKGEMPVSYVHNFLNYYGDNLLFELFLYPHFEKRTIFAVNFNLLLELFNYLNECCKRLDLALTAQFPMMITRFSWNNIPGQDELGLLTSLKVIFDLRHTESLKTRIEKIENVIKIITPQWSIQPPEDPINRTLDYSSGLIERRIYELVSDIGSDPSQDEKSNIILAQDDKFMALLENVHNNKHNKFEKGYHQLMELRKRR